MTVAPVSNGPSCDTYTNKTRTNGPGDNRFTAVYAVGTTVYAGFPGGLSISTDGGSTFVNKNPGVFVYAVYAEGNKVYAASPNGLSISNNGGSTFSNKTTANGLGSDIVSGVYAVGNTVYAATDGGLSISQDGGNTFINKTTANGLGSSNVIGVYAVAGPTSTTVYAATNGGLGISTNGGSSFTNRTTTNGLGSSDVRGVYAVGSTIYAATGGGVSISTDGGSSFTNKTTANGLGGNSVNGVYAVGSTVYAATFSGLSISIDGGSTFSNKTTANGLGDNAVKGVYAAGTTVYAATDGGLSFCQASTTPVITAQPASASGVCAGAGVSVPVTVTGATTYRWLNGSSPVSGQTSATLTLTNVQPADAGVYSLSATGPGGSVISNSFTLSVNTAVTAITPSALTICEERSLGLTAGLSGTGAYTITFGLFNGPTRVASVSATGPTASISIPQGLSASSLTVVAVTTSAGGCSTTFTGPTVTIQFITFAGPPTFTKTQYAPGETMVVSFSAAQCGFKSGAPYSIELLSSVSNYTIATSVNPTAANATSLSYTIPANLPVGTYKLQVVYGDPVYSPVSVTFVVSSLTLTITASTTQICVGQPVSLTAAGCGPGSTYQWSTGQSGSIITYTPASTSLVSVTCVTAGAPRLGVPDGIDSGDGGVESQPVRGEADRPAELLWRAGRNPRGSGAIRGRP